MISNTYNALVLLGTPTKWPMIIRRIFVLFFPITIPLLMIAWMMFLVAFLGTLVAGCLWCILMECVNSMLIVWGRRE